MHVQNRIQFATFVVGLGASQHGSNMVVNTLKLRNSKVFCKYI